MGGEYGRQGVRNGREASQRRGRACGLPPVVKDLTRGLAPAGTGTGGAPPCCIHGQPRVTTGPSHGPFHAHDPPVTAGHDRRHCMDSTDMEKSMMYIRGRYCPCSDTAGHDSTDRRIYIIYERLSRLDVCPAEKSPSDGRRRAHPTLGGDFGGHARPSSSSRSYPGSASHRERRCHLSQPQRPPEPATATSPLCPVNKNKQNLN